MSAINPGDVVQLSPVNTDNKAFSGCFMVVTDVKSWGVQGYVQVLGPNRDLAGGQAYYRAATGTFQVVGKAWWVVMEEEPPPAS